MDFLAAIFDVALDHQSFDQFVDVVAVTAAVMYFFCNKDLLQILLVVSILWNIFYFLSM